MTTPTNEPEEKGLPAATCSALIPVKADDWAEMVRASRRDKEQRHYLTMILDTIDGGGRVVTFQEQDIQTLRGLLQNS